MDQSVRVVERVVERVVVVVATLAAAVVCVVVVPTPPPSYAGKADPAWGVVRTSADGSVRWTAATERAGWQDRASDDGPWSFRAWSYPRYPLNCGAQAGPAYQLIWAQRAGDPHASLLDTRRPAVRAEVRRASSVFAASWAHVIDSAEAKLADHTPRVVTSRGRGGQCQVRIDRVQVPREVWRREPYENYDHDRDPATPPRQGVFAWLQARGYDRSDRRYVVVQQGPGVWNLGGGMAMIAANGVYAPLDDQPGPQNRNEAAGTWIAINVRESGADLDPFATGNLGELLAHEWTHSLGSVLQTAPHYNALNPNGGHPADCADVLCYNNYDAEGQHYVACGGAAADTFRSFSTDPRDPRWGLDAPQASRWAYRLDCGRNDYWGVDVRTGADKPWTARRWSTHHSRWLWGNPDVYTGPDFDLGAHNVPPACASDPRGWCPDGAPNGVAGARATS